MSSHIFASPIGAITVSGDGTRLLGVRIGSEDALAGELPADPLLAEAARQITAYFHGGLSDFDLPLAPASTPRGEELRAAIAAIPFGETASYGEIARRYASAPRAIGQACKRNPFPIVVPCHRVIGGGGTIGYYSGGEGVATKARLLNHEAGDGGASWPE